MDIQQVIKKNKWIITIFAIALLVRVLFVFSMPIKLWDETVYLNLGYDLSQNPMDYSFSNGWSDFIPSEGDDFYGWPKAGFRAPLLPYIISLFYFFNLDFFLNILLPFVGALSAVLVYILGKELFNYKVGILSSLFFVFIPLHAFYSGRVLTEVLLTFFILLTFISFWKGYEKENKKHKVLFGVFLALALLSRYTALWIIPIFPLYFLIRDKSVKFLKDKYLWCSILAFFLILIPWFIYGIFEYNNPIGAFVHGFKASAYWGGLQSWFFFFDVWWEMFSVIGFIFVVSLAYFLYNKDFLKKEVYLLLIWLMFFLGMAVYMPHKEDRFIIPIIPSLVILSAFFISKITQYKKIIVSAILVILIFSSVSNFYNNYNLYYNINTDCFEQAGLELKEIQGNFLIVSENPPLLRYYTKQESAYYPDVLNEKTIKELEYAAKKPVYFVFTKFNSGFETEKWQNLKKIMEERYNLVFECSEDKEVNWIYSSTPNL
ncbi:glycosyltransferase family 39 protein [Candidatus Pacearchaeota archaeon]|nr:glycosyltransferase family 39 protein [Candidatus Pacearchaeota archaeon]